MKQMMDEFKLACTLSLTGVALIGADALYEHFASTQYEVVSSAHAAKPAPLTAKQANDYCAKILAPNPEGQTYQTLAGRLQRSFDFCVKSVKTRAAALRQ